MDLTLTTNIRSRDSLVGARQIQIDFSYLSEVKNSSLAPDRAPISFFWPRNTNRVLKAPLPAFSIIGNSSPGPTRTQLEIRKDRKISTRVLYRTPLVQALIITQVCK